jgi:cytochrome c peroxidase
MKIKFYIKITLASFIVILFSFKKNENTITLSEYFIKNHFEFYKEVINFKNNILTNEFDIQKIENSLIECRKKLKVIDLFLRYSEPVLYRSINGVLEVEWETEVFEKYEKPYKRVGRGIYLAQAELMENEINKEKLVFFVSELDEDLKKYLNDTIINEINKPYYFPFAARIYILNLLTIYTTGFENPDTSLIVDELKISVSEFIKQVKIYENTVKIHYQEEFHKTINEMYGWLDTQKSYLKFDHYFFIKKFITKLYSLNQEFISKQNLKSKQLIDYSLNNKANQIFSKNLYYAQNTKGIYSNVNKKEDTDKILRFGSLIFSDPKLSGNNKRSCSSCHKPENFFTDNSRSSALNFNQTGFLQRNTPDLMAADRQHLIMWDGRHLDLMEQFISVIQNKDEMNGNINDIMKKILSCRKYKKYLKALCKLTPAYPHPDIRHVGSSVIFFYTRLSTGISYFDECMNGQHELNDIQKKGFNLFMGKAQCATCHFLPQFNGVKPPYISSEFEVLGTPDKFNPMLPTTDSGRYKIHPAFETLRAHRTPTLRNITKTAPYMHNGIFKNLEEVIDFYDSGGGAGKKINLKNQTLSPDSLHLTKDEKIAIVEFLKTLDEKTTELVFPEKLPKSKFKELNNRKLHGEY